MRAAAFRSRSESPDRWCPRIYKRRAAQHRRRCPRDETCSSLSGWLWISVMMSGEMRSKIFGFTLTVLMAAGAAAQAQSLDFETYRTRVEPVFLKKRAGHARCV